MSKHLTRFFVAAVVVSLRPSAALPQDASPVVLQLKGHLGDSWVVNTHSRERTSVPPLIVERSLDGTSRITVEAVAPAGRMTLRGESEIIRIRVSIWRGNTLAEEHDSDRPADRQDPKLLDLLGKPFTSRVEMEPTGEIRRFKGDSAAEDPTMEQAMTQGTVTLPSQPVRVGERWDGGTFSHPIAGLGRLDYAREVVFDSIGVRGGERVAYLKGTDRVTVKADSESGVSVSVTDAKVDELWALAIDRGRWVLVHMDKSVNLDTARNGGHSPVSIEATVEVREQR